MPIVFVGAVQLAVFCLVLVAVCLVWVRRKRALHVGKGSFRRKRLRTTEAGFEGNCLKMFHSLVWFMPELGAGALRGGCLTPASAFPPLSAPVSGIEEDTLGECGHKLSCLNFFFEVYGVVYVICCVFP